MRAKIIQDEIEWEAYLSHLKARFPWYEQRPEDKPSSFPCYVITDTIHYLPHTRWSHYFIYQESFKCICGVEHTRWRL